MKPVAAGGKGHLVNAICDTQCNSVSGVLSELPVHVCVSVVVSLRQLSSNLSDDFLGVLLK